MAVRGRGSCSPYSLPILLPGLVPAACCLPLLSFSPLSHFPCLLPPPSAVSLSIPLSLFCAYDMRTPPTFIYLPVAARRCIYARSSALPARARTPAPHRVCRSRQQTTACAFLYLPPARYRTHRNRKRVRARTRLTTTRPHPILRQTCGRARRGRFTLRCGMLALYRTPSPCARSARVRNHFVARCDALTSAILPLPTARRVYLPRLSCSARARALLHIGTDVDK